MSKTKNKITIEDLVKDKKLNVVPGWKFIPKQWLNKKNPSLEEVHKRLSKFKGSLAEEISNVLLLFINSKHC